MEFTIGKRRVGKGHSTFIIAEASSNHGNDLKRAKKLIDVAVEAGADAVKFQLFTAEKLVADTPDLIIRPGDKGVYVKRNTKLIDLFKANELPVSWLASLHSYAKKKDILFLATPFDEDAVQALHRVHVPAYKIASNEILDVELLKAAARTKKPIIISTGMANLGDIETSLEILKKNGNRNVAILHCNSAYPSPAHKINLRAIRTLQKAFPTSVVGYSDHSLGYAVPVAAVALGASIIEKHFILDDGVRTVDDPFSLTPRELKSMVGAIRLVEASLGTTEKIATEKQKARSLWITKPITKGEKLSKDNLKILRPGRGLSPIHYDIFIGKRAVRDIAPGPLSWNDVLL